MKSTSIKNSLILEHSLRFEGEHYLNENAFLAMHMKSCKLRCKSLDDIAHVFNPPVFKRQFCKKTSRSVPYYQSSDVNNVTEDSNVYVYKGQAEHLNLLVKQGDILITGFGSIGNTRLVSTHQDGACYANNVCRVRIKDPLRNGYLYAFLSSKFANAQLNNNASGSVVRYIESPGIKRTLVPTLSSTKEDEINDLIQVSMRLREESTSALRKAHELIYKHITVNFNTHFSGNVSYKDIMASHQHRLDGMYHLSKGKQLDDFIKRTFPWSALGSLTKSISRPDICKRIYVKDGITFLGGTDIFLSIPNSKKKLSRKTPNIDDYTIQEGWILLPRSGTIGDAVYTTSQHAQKLVSEDVIRIIPNDKISGGYIYAFLSSKIGKALIQRPIFGSVIQHIEPPHLSLIPIPQFQENTIAEIASLAEEHRTKWGEAAKLESLAIRMVEQEIESIIDFRNILNDK